MTARGDGTYRTKVTVGESGPAHRSGSEEVPGALLFGGAPSLLAGNVGRAGRLC